jgi:DHA1 family bicyclomycin/chloramphenicol resistance-like MFS transporter
MGTTEQLKPRHGALMANLVGQLAFGLVLMTVCIPSMQDWPATFGASQAAVQLTFSGFVAAFGGLQLVFGPWSDRIGRKPVLVLGLVLAVAGSALAALAPGLGTLTVARVLQGAGCAAGMVTARAMVQDLFDGPERTRMMAFIGMAMGLCPPLGTIVGGQLHVHAGWQANFWLMAGVGALLLVAAVRGLPASAPQAAPAGGALRALVSSYRQLLAQPAFLLYVTILAAGTATFYSFLGGVPLVLKAYGVTPDRVGFHVMCIPLAYIVGNLLTTRLVRSHGDRVLTAWGQACTVAGILVVLVLGIAGVRSPLAVSLPLMLVGIGHGLLVPSTLAGTVGLLPALAGAAAAVAGLMQQMTGAVAGYVVGWVPHDSQVNLAVLMLAWAMLGVAAQWWLQRGVLPRRAGAGT